MINEILARQTSLLPMSDDDFARHRAATKCVIYNCLFTLETYKVKHDDYVTGEYLFLACYKCNLQLKPKKCKFAGTDKDSNSYFSLIFFHNLKNYDSHYVIKHFQNSTHERVTRKVNRSCTMMSGHTSEWRAVPSVSNKKRKISGFLLVFVYISRKFNRITFEKWQTQSFTHSEIFSRYRIHLLQRHIPLQLRYRQKQIRRYSNYLLSKIFTTIPFTTNRCPQKTTNVLIRFGIFITYKTFANTTITTYCQTYFC